MAEGKMPSQALKQTWQSIFCDLLLETIRLWLHDVPTSREKENFPDVSKICTLLLMMTCNGLLLSWILTQQSMLYVFFWSWTQGWTGVPLTQKNACLLSLGSQKMLCRNKNLPTNPIATFATILVILSSPITIALENKKKIIAFTKLMISLRQNLRQKKFCLVFLLNLLLCLIRTIEYETNVRWKILFPLLTLVEYHHSPLKTMGSQIESRCCSPERKCHYPLVSCNKNISTLLKFKSLPANNVGFHMCSLLRNKMLLNETIKKF